MERIIYLCDMCGHDYLSKEEKLDYVNKEGITVHVCLNCEKIFKELQALKSDISE